LSVWGVVDWLKGFFCYLKATDHLDHGGADGVFELFFFKDVFEATEIEVFPVTVAGRYDGNMVVYGCFWVVKLPLTISDTTKCGAILLYHREFTGKVAVIEMPQDIGEKHEI